MKSHKSVEKKKVSSSSKKVSIIIRTKNEEKWITSCLRTVFNQTYKNFEVILVDNLSTDKTVDKAKAFDVKIVSIDDFLPGKAINKGIRESRGEILVMISGHCIPTNDKWLENLIRNFKDKKVVGVYGRQEPLPFSRAADKRDLMVVFGLDRKVQQRDPFFHNANSAIRRNVWEEIPFDEEVTNIEDRVWGRQVISKGYEIVYDPEASVYHYHGIHQDGNEDRCRNVVRILESLEIDTQKEKKVAINVEDLNIVTIIPVIGSVEYCGKKPLLDYTIQAVQDSKLIKKVIVSTDNQSLAKIAKKAGAEVPFLRPKELSLEYVSLNMVLQYTLNRLEEEKILPDIVIVTEVTYPFRPHGLVDKLILKLIEEGFDSIIPVKRENRSVWLKDEKETKLITEGFIPRQLRDSQLFISLLGLGFCTYPHFIREGRMVGDKVGILEVADLYSQIEVRGKESIAFANQIIGPWWEDNKAKKI